jgi:hypothetical protein
MSRVRFPSPAPTWLECRLLVRIVAERRGMLASTALAPASRGPRVKVPEPNLTMFRQATRFIKSLRTCDLRFKPLLYPPEHPIFAKTHFTGARYVTTSS